MTSSTPLCRNTPQRNVAQSSEKNGRLTWDPHLSQNNNFRQLDSSASATDDSDFYSPLSGGLRQRTRQEEIKKQFLHFCSNTTIRGVPRIVKSKNKRIRCLWVIFVQLLFLGLFFCMFFLAKQYLEYNVIHPPRVLRDTYSPFPSITVCNLRPFSPQGRQVLKERGWKNPREFAQSVNHHAISMYFKNNLKKEYQRVTSAISMGGYLESLPEGSSMSLGHKLDDSIIYCQGLYLNGSQREANKCSELGRWTHFVHAQYMNCHTFNLLQKFRMTTKTLEIYLYLDEDHATTRCIDCFSSDVKSQLSGAVIVIHKAKTYPNLNQESINLQPGTLTEIKLKTIENIQKEPPHGRCSPNTPKYIDLYDFNYAYSEYACRLTKIQQDIMEECKCKAIEYPFAANITLPFCSAMPSYLNKSACMNPRSNDEPSCKQELKNVLKRSNCKSRILLRYQGDIVPTCTLPCSFYSYESDRSTSMWPTKTWQLNWISSGRARRVAKKKELQIYRTIRQLSTTNESAAAELLGQTNILERNLLAVLLNRPNFNLHKVEEKEVLSLTGFLSQSGGLFSIWVGLTMISIVELIEFLCHVIFALRTSKSPEKGGAESQRQSRLKTTGARMSRRRSVDSTLAEMSAGGRGLDRCAFPDVAQFSCNHNENPTSCRTCCVEALF